MTVTEVDSEGREDPRCERDRHVGQSEHRLWDSDDIVDLAVADEDEPVPEDDCDETS